MRRYMSIWLFVAAFVFTWSNLCAQTDTIHGVINIYTRVLAIDTCNSALVVHNPLGFHPGDKALLMQMKGSRISTVDDSTFGDIVGVDNAGNYELVTIDAVNGATIILRYRMVRTYTISGFVQLIRVPVYHNVVINGELDARAWDGSTGGVLALCASDTVKLRDDGIILNASGMGFRGGDTSIFDATSASDLGYRFSSSTHRGGGKGEGIAIVDLTLAAGRGKSANGGGGGNTRSAGGAGGGNYGNGGHGGDQYRAIADLPIGGFGGSALTYSNSVQKIFLGGGGGGGQRSSFNGLPPIVGNGKPGGGIVFIQANILDGNGGTIEANGLGFIGNSQGASVQQDGAGGGGGGGAILLDVSYFPSDFTLNAIGGDGQATKSALSPGNNECFGPGGGGGGGVIWARSQVALGIGGMYSGHVADEHAGAAGTQTVGPGGSFTCGTYGATAGTDGTVLDGLQVPRGTVPR